MQHKSVELRAASSGTYTQTTYQGRDFLVVPVVAMVEGVVRPVNAEAPELVLAAELAKTPMGWNGRPVLLNHPQTDKGDYTSANSPEVLETSLGYVFNASGRDQILTEKRLTMEAWVDVAACAANGAQEVVNRILAGEIIEVSVGAFVGMDPVAGDWNGEPYSLIWRNVMPDHLALLSLGQRGACSVDMGCGVRALVAPKEETKVVTPSLKERLMGQLASLFRSNSEPSDAELRDKLFTAIYAVEPGFQFLEAVFPESGKVVYHTMPEQEWKTYERSFSLGEDGVVTLAEDRQEVALKTEYVPVGDEPKAAASCGCGSGKTETTIAAPTSETIMSQETAPTVVPVVSPTPTVAAATTEPPKVKSEAEWMAEAPPAIRSLVERSKAQEAKEKAQLVEALKDNGVYSADELNAKEVPELQKLAALAGTKVAHVDFGGQGTPRVNDEEAVPEPPDMNAAIRSARAAKETK